MAFEYFPSSVKQWNHLPNDVLLQILCLVDLPTRLAALCVCKDWFRAGSEPWAWEVISIPRGMSFRLWDDEFKTLVRRAKGRRRVTRLHVSGSGITGKSLIRLLEAEALAPVVEELHFEDCCNLKLCDILAFVQALAPHEEGPSTGPAKLQHHDPEVVVVVRAARQHLPGQEGMEAALGFRRWVAALAQGSAETGAVGSSGAAARRHTVVVKSLRVRGCKQLSAWEVRQLQALVGTLDVSVCSCGRVGVLKRCTGLPPGAVVAANGSVGGRIGMPSGSSQPRSSTPSAGGAVPAVQQSLVAGVPHFLSTGGQAAERTGRTVRVCPGLCGACAELFKGCAEGVCGACCEPEGGLRMVMRTRLRLWNARLEALEDLRSHWTDIRRGLETTMHRA